MSQVIVKYKDKIWKAKGINFHQDHYHGRVALLIRLKNNHTRLIYPASYLQSIDADNNYCVDIHEGELQPKRSHETILKIIDDNNIVYAEMQTKAYHAQVQEVEL